MKNKLILIIFLFLLIPITFAELSIDRLKVYVNEVRQTTIESITGNKDAGAIEDISAGDIIDLNFRFKNTYNETAKDIEATITIEDIDDGSNLVQKIAKFDLEYDKDITKEVSFTVPTNVRVDNYNLIIEVNGYYTNYTDPDYTIEFEVDVISSSEEKKFNLVDAFGNMTQKCQEYLTTSNERFNYADKLQQCEYNKGSTESQLTTCNTNLSVLEVSKANCENSKSSMLLISECNDKVSKAKQEWYPIAGIVIAVWFFFLRKKPESNSKYTEHHEGDKFFK